MAINYEGFNKLGRTNKAYLLYYGFDSLLKNISSLLIFSVIPKNTDAGKLGKKLDDKKSFRYFR